MSTYNDLKNITWDFGQFTGDKTPEKKPKRIPDKQRIENLEDQVVTLINDIAGLNAKLRSQTAVYTPYRLHRMLDFFSKPEPRGETVYAAEAIRMILRHLDIHFQHEDASNKLEPIPPPVEYDEEDYADDEA